jgi:salicylate hydroxylase
MAESHPSTKSFTVAIIGGGLGGVLLAISLSNRNLPFHIYESASNFTETSAGLGFGPNAVRTMAKLDPRIYDAYAALKTENKQDNKKDTWFDFWLGHGDLEQVGELKMGSLGGGNVLRASFLLEMAKLLPEGCVTFGKKLLEVEETNGYAILRFADGTSTDADVVVGCDGIRSKVRESLLGKDHEAGKPVFVGVYLYRGVVKMESAIAAVGEYFAQNSQVYMGRDRNIATYPIENGTMLNVVAYRKQKEETWEHERWVVESSRDKMIEDFGDFHESIQKLLQVWHCI